ncbi:DUF4317 domain-containing protein [Oscillospiraceae bacterium MB08-C2-2]|nr:DUF4317 domain-containing protein [Oscillospiraceae bacterium MB08-C2-2]
MNEKEISEIRRRFRPEKSNITNICGCYVNTSKEIVSEFNQSIALMTEDESEKFIAILKKTLSGTLNKNLLPIEFTTQQVVSGEEHKLLMSLRDSVLKDEEAIQNIFKKVIEAITLEENYLILLAYDTYDIPYRSKDGGKPDDSSEVFSYIVCSVCPVKMTKSALSYYAHTNEFHSSAADWIVSPPEMGFMFPAFDDRCSNIYGTLYYTRDAAESREEFVQAVFGCEAPMPAVEQKETFQAILSSTLEEECSFQTVQLVHEQLQEMIEEHKANKEEEPLTISKGNVKQMLRAHGVSDTHIEAFEEQFDQQFGSEMTLSPKNIVDVRHMELTAPNIKIQVSSSREGLVETRVIDGVKYILIRAEEGIELNGVPVHIS